MRNQNIYQIYKVILGEKYQSNGLLSLLFGDQGKTFNVNLATTKGRIFEYFFRKEEKKQYTAIDRKEMGMQ